MSKKAARRARRAHEREQHHKAMAHEVRVDILTYLYNHSTGSPSAIAREIGASVETVNGHMKQLVRYEAVEFVEKRQSRSGPPEHVYRAIRRPILEDVSHLSLSARHGNAKQSVEAIFDDVEEAAEADLFAKRTDWILTRTAVLLDNEGLEELQELHARLVEEALEVEARSNARRSKSGEPGQRVSTGQLCFVLP